MFIIHRLPGNILDSTIGNIKYRNNVVTGVVAVDNDNNTYDCYISGSDIAYPKIPTTFPEPAFEVDDAVEILIEYGNKEMPIIIGYAKKVVQDFVEDEVNVLVTTIGSHTIAQTSAYLEGRIEEIDGYENCTKKGFYYGISTGYGLEKSSTGSFVAGSYSLQATGLTAGETYHFQAFVNDVDGDEHTGEDKTFVTAEAILGEIFISYETGPGGSEVSTIRSFTTDGVACTSWQPEEYQLMCQGMCVDSSGNVYYIAFTSPHKIIKYNSAGTEITSLSVSSQVQAIAIANDGYVYTLENTQTDNDIMTKRNPTTLAEISSFQMDPTHSYYGLAFLDDDYFYTVNSTDDVIELWRVSTENEVLEVAVDSGKTTLTSLAVAGATVLGTDLQNQPWYVPTNLSTGEIDWSIEITDCLSVASKDGYFYVFGTKVYAGALFLGKYSENGVEQWEVEVVAVTDPATYPSCVAAYPF